MFEILTQADWERVIPAPPGAATIACPGCAAPVKLWPRAEDPARLRGECLACWPWTEEQRAEAERRFRAQQATPTS